MTITKQQTIIGLVILVVVALGLIIINQFVSFQYKAQLLANPCDECSRIHPNIVCEEINSGGPGSFYLGNITLPHD